MYVRGALLTVLVASLACGSAVRVTAQSPPAAEADLIERLVVATSLMVPSPPQATTSIVPRASAARVRSPACPGPCVRCTSPVTPAWASSSVASAARRRPASGCPRAPEMGLMITATRIDARGPQCVSDHETQAGSLNSVGAGVPSLGRLDNSSARIIGTSVCLVPQVGAKTSNAASTAMTRTAYG
jgi:hypothetical protein